MNLNRKISVIIPAYNEEFRLPHFLIELDLFFKSKHFDKYEIIVIDDGSFDDTYEVVKKLNIKNTLVLKHERNLGKGAALKTGINKASCDIAFLMDADGAYCPTLILEVIKKLSENCQIIIGQRILYKSSILEFHTLRIFLGRIFNLFCRFLLKIPFHDTQCGFKAGNLETLKVLFNKQTEFRFGYDLELLFNAIKENFVIETISVNARETIGTSVKLSRATISMIKTVTRLFIRSLETH